MPRHTGQPVDYVAPLKGNVRIRTDDGYRGLLGKCPCVLVAMCFCPGRNIVPMGWWQSAWRCTGVGCIGNLGIWQLRCWTAKVAVRNIANVCSRNSIFTITGSILRWIGERRITTARLGRWLVGYC